MSLSCPTPDISLIVPVYNVQDYLPQCLDSLLNQNLKNYTEEIIIVNDGSTDASTEILQTYAEKYPHKFTLIFQQNQGLSAARNTGLRHAHGRWIGFIDSDDYIDATMFATLLDITKTHDVDYVECGVTLEGKVPNAKSDTLTHYFKAKKLGYQKVTPKDYTKLATTVWNKIFKHDIIKSQNLNFPEGHYYEDTVFFRNYLHHVHAYYRIPQQLYHYLLRDNSITGEKTQSSQKINDLFITATLMFNYASQQNLPQQKEKIKRAFRIIHRNFIQACQQSSKDNNPTLLHLAQQFWNTPTTQTHKQNAPWATQLLFEELLTHTSPEQLQNVSSNYIKSKTSFFQGLRYLKGKIITPLSSHS